MIRYFHNGSHYLLKTPNKVGPTPHHRRQGRTVFQVFASAVHCWSPMPPFLIFLYCHCHHLQKEWLTFFLSSENSFQHHFSTTTLLNYMVKPMFDITKFCLCFSKSLNCAEILKIKAFDSVWQLLFFFFFFYLLEK